MKKIIYLFLIAVIALYCAGTAAADDFHYTNLLIGDRASGMGGTYTAVSDDATGLYYNPAGIVYSAGRNISASVNAYYATDKKYKRAIGSNDWRRTSSSLLPNYFGVVQPVGKYQLGLSYAVPESIMADQEQTFRNLPLSTVLALNPTDTIDTYIINFNEETSTYNFGPSIARELTNDLSAGITLYYYQRKVLQILNQLANINNGNGGFEWTNNYLHSDESGLRPVLGFMWTPIDKVSVGLALSKIIILRSETTFQISQLRENTAADVNNLPDGPSSIGEKRKYPTQVSLGAAWFPSASILVSTDINYFTRVDQQIVALDGQFVLFRPTAEDVVNIAIGTEGYISKNWALRGGVYTNLANTPTIESGGVNQSEHIDLYGLTFSASHFTRNTAVTLGSGYTFGEGKAQIIGNDTRIQDAESQGWMVFLSSSYSY